MAAEDIGMADPVCFREFLEQWTDALQIPVPLKCNFSSTMSNGNLPEDSASTFEEYANAFLPPDVITELDAECRDQPTRCCKWCKLLHIFGHQEDNYLLKDLLLNTLESKLMVIFKNFKIALNAEEHDILVGIETLVCDGEPRDIQTLLIEIPEDVDLACVQHQRAEIEKRQADPAFRNKALDKMKYRNRDGPWKHELLQQSAKSGPDGKAHSTKVEPRVQATLPDIIVTVQIFRPFPKKKSPVLEYEFHVLGQQLLTELRDRIVCPSDHVAVGDFSENPDAACEIETKDLYKSGMFFFEGIFFNDTRDPNCRDYSRPVLEWAKKNPSSAGPYHSQTMQSTRFIDLTARLGQPYVYIHQGDCEHLVIFSDLRLLHPEDCQFLDSYPVMVYRSRERKPTCRVCLMHLARWVTCGSPLAPEDPCFFCETCFRALHYDSNGKRLTSDLRVYPYRDVRALKN